jgi:hypothetical protein
MNFKFEVTKEEGDLILLGLSELQYKVSAELITKIQKQASVQLNTNG